MPLMAEPWTRGERMGVLQWTRCLRPTESSAETRPFGGVWMRMPEAPGVASENSGGKLASRFFLVLGGREGEKRNFESSWMRFFCWFGTILEKGQDSAVCCARVRCIVELCFFAFAAKLLTQ